MRKWWWKILAVVILVYVITAGFLVPLRPGIESVTPASARAGEELVLQVRGYNTDFRASEGNLRAWLKLDDTLAVLSQGVEVRSERELVLRFNVPRVNPLGPEVHALSLVTDDPVHGAMVMPSAVFMSGSEMDRRTTAWSLRPIVDLHQNDSFVYPYRSILYETIRNTYFHVPMWFGMILLFFASGWYAIRYVRHGLEADDQKSLAFATSGTVFGILGILTGMLWSTYTWGEPWSWDVKQNTAAITLLIYLAYFVLRKSFDDPDRRARTASVYNIFGCAMIIPLLFVIPRMTDSLHPGSGGNPALGGEDLDNTMRMIFYPAVIGWTLLGVWFSELVYRIHRLEILKMG